MSASDVLGLVAAAVGGMVLGIALCFPTIERERSATERERQRRVSVETRLLTERMRTDRKPPSE